MNYEQYTDDVSVHRHHDPHISRVDDIFQGGRGMTDLKPCPFCGSDNIKIHIGYSHSYIRCEDCIVSTRRYKSIQDAIDGWNRRVNE